MAIEKQMVSSQVKTNKIKVCEVLPLKLMDKPAISTEKNAIS